MALKRRANTSEVLGGKMDQFRGWDLKWTNTARNVLPREVEVGGMKKFDGCKEEAVEWLMLYGALRWKDIRS